MDQAIKHWVGLWDHLDHNFWGFWKWAHGHLRPGQVGWQPNEHVASIGWNLWHLAEMLDHYMAHVFANAKQIQAGALITMVDGSEDDGRFHDLDAIAAYHRNVRPAYRAFLVGLSLADLAQDQGRRGHDWGWAIGHIAEHESYHLGKCMLLRNLIPNSNHA